MEEALRLVEATAAGGGLSAAVLDIKLDGEHVSAVADTLATLGVPFLVIQSLLRSACIFLVAGRLAREF